jgi:hypothetical protein
VSILKFWFRKQGRFPLRKDHVRSKTGLPLPEVKKTHDLRNRALFLAQKLWSRYRKSQLGASLQPVARKEYANVRLREQPDSGRYVKAEKTGADAILSLKGELRWRWNRIFKASKQ